MDKVKSWFQNKFAFLKDKQHVFYYFVFLFVLALIMSSVVLLTESLTIPLGGDYVQQQIPFYTNGYDDWWHFIKTGEFPLWDSNTVLGVNNIGANSFYYFLNPFFLPILLFPRSIIPQGLAFLMLIKMALAGITFRAYLKYMGVEERTARIFAIAYAFCGWNLYYMWFNHFMEVVVMFPLVLLGIEKVLKERKPISLMISLCVLGLANYFFLVVACFAGVIYAGFRYFQTIKSRNVKENFLAIGMGVAGFAVGLMMCAIVLLPCLNAVTEAGRVSNATYLESLKTCLDEKNLERLWNLIFDFDSSKKKYYPLATYFFPVVGDFNCLLYRNTGYDNTLSSLFIYTPLTIMLIPAIIESVRKKKISHIIAIAGFVLMLFTPFFYELFHGFTVDYGRWQLFAVIAMITYVALNYQHLSEYPKWYFDCSVVTILLCMTFTVVTAMKNQYGVYDIKETFAIVIYQFVYTLVAYFLIRKNYKKPTFSKMLTIMLSIEVVIVGNFTLFGQKTTYSSLAGGPSNYSDEVRVVKKINENDDSYFRIFNTTANEATTNLGMWENYNGVGGFHSLYNSNIKDFLNWTRMLYWRDTWIMGDHEKIANLEQFLGVKYYILRSSDYNALSNGEVINDLNTYNVPYGYEYREDLSTTDHKVFENTNFVEFAYAFDNIIPVNRNSVENYMYLDNNYSYIYYQSRTRNDGASRQGYLLDDFKSVIKNDEALLSGAILYDVSEDGFAEENEYSEDTLKALQEFPVNDFDSYSGKLYAYPELNVVRYSCPDGVGDSLEDLLNVSNCTPVYGSTTPYQYGNTKYVLTLSNGGSFCKANEPCYLGLKLQMNRYSYVHLYDEEGKIITFDYHQYVNQDYKNLRGFYTNKPVKTIVVKPMINEGDNTNMNGFAVYEEGYSSYLNRINAIKANPISNVKKSTNKITFSTNFDANKIVVTTIPYDAGWTLTRKDKNGVVTTPQLFKAQGGFCAFVGEANQMEYEMTYFTPQLKQGLVVSLMGFILFGTTIFVFNYIDKKKKGTKKNKIKEEVVTTPDTKEIEKE